MISSLEEVEREYSSCFFWSPADSLYVLPMVPMLPLSYACRSAGAWGKLLLCSGSGECCGMDQLIVESPSELGKAAQDRFEIEGRAPKRVKGRM